MTATASPTLATLQPSRARSCDPLSRTPVRPALVLGAYLLVGVLRGFFSQLALWRRLAQRGLWASPRFASPFARSNEFRTLSQT